MKIINYLKIIYYDILYGEDSSYGEYKKKNQNEKSPHKVKNLKFQEDLQSIEYNKFCKILDFIFERKKDYIEMFNKFDTDKKPKRRNDQRRIKKKKCLSMKIRQSHSNQYKICGIEGKFRSKSMENVGKNMVFYEKLGFSIRNSRKYSQNNRFYKETNNESSKDICDNSLNNNSNLIISNKSHDLLSIRKNIEPLDIKYKYKYSSNSNPNNDSNLNNLNLNKEVSNTSIKTPNFKNSSLNDVITDNHKEYIFNYNEIDKKNDDFNMEYHSYMHNSIDLTDLKMNKDENLPKNQEEPKKEIYKIYRNEIINSIPTLNENHIQAKDYIKEDEPKSILFYNDYNIDKQEFFSFKLKPHMSNLNINLNHLNKSIYTSEKSIPKSQISKSSTLTENNNKSYKTASLSNLNLNINNNENNELEMMFLTKDTFDQSMIPNPFQENKHSKKYFSENNSPTSKRLHMYKKEDDDMFYHNHKYHSKEKNIIFNAIQVQNSKDSICKLKNNCIPFGNKLDKGGDEKLKNQIRTRMRTASLTKSKKSKSIMTSSLEPCLLNTQNDEMIYENNKNNSIINSMRNLNNQRNMSNISNLSNVSYVKDMNEINNLHNESNSKLVISTENYNPNIKINYNLYDNIIEIKDRDKLNKVQEVNHINQIPDEASISISFGEELKKTQFFSPSLILKSDDVTISINEILTEKQKREVKTEENKQVSLLKNQKEKENKKVKGFNFRNNISSDKFRRMPMNHEEKRVSYINNSNKEINDLSHMSISDLNSPFIGRKDSGNEISFVNNNSNIFLNNSNQKDYFDVKK